jgi:hypothetical protein
MQKESHRLNELLLKPSKDSKEPADPSEKKDDDKKKEDSDVDSTISR